MDFVVFLAIGADFIYGVVELLGPNNQIKKGLLTSLLVKRNLRWWSC